MIFAGADLVMMDDCHSTLWIPNVGAVGAFFYAEGTHVRKNLPLRHDGDSDYGSK